ncbi:pumilio homolog 23 [Homalodisca vitripennis]|uniref:pumilio homolog 23 n=1 Tax=Homalodisca vitripennis TaxID=197043 RepID=UPI001EEA79F0|nr:pumilio homolog 23 [Homalodisca vitripennis]
MQSNVSDQCDNSTKRKKKRSLNQQVKKRFKKSSSFSKGRRFEQVEHEYFMRVFELESIFEGSKDEKTIFANNALAQTANREVDCAFNQLISHVIEKLLPLATNDVLERYFQAFGENLRPICGDNFASHVLQALLLQATQRLLQGNSTDIEGVHAAQWKDWVLKVSRFLLNNIEEFMWERYASPVLRTAVFCLAGLPHLDKHSVTKDKGKKANHNVISVKQEEINPLKFPEEFLNLLEEFPDRIMKWPNFKEFVDDSLSSGFLQCLLIALKLKSRKKYTSLCNKILDECFPPNAHESKMFSPVALPVLEVVIEQSKDKMLRKIYDCLLSKRLVDMATARVAQITLQKFINKCNNAEMLEEILNALIPMQNLLQSGNHGVLVSLCQACERLKKGQSKFFQALKKALCVEDDCEQLVPAIMAMTPLPHQSSLRDSKHGSLIIQSILGFQKPTKVVNSLLSYEPKQLADLLSTSFGSFITKAYCKSEYVGEKSRLKLIQKLMGRYSYMAKSIFGSRSFDDIWEVADFKSRTMIVKDLAGGYSELTTTSCGRGVMTKVRLEDYRSKGEEHWKRTWQKIESKRKLFAPIIGNVK